MLDVVVLTRSKVNYGSDTPSQISTHGGGAAANTATWLAYGRNQVFFVARTGDDPAANAVIAELDYWNIEHKELRNPKVKTGVVVVVVDETGQRTMFPDSGANSGLAVDDLPELENFDAAFLSGYSLFNKASTAGIEEMIARIKVAGIPLLFDPASVGTITEFGKEKALSYLSQMDVLLLNEEEALYLTDCDDVKVAIHALQKLYTTVVIKTGSAGAIGSHKQSAPVIAHTNAITPTDTTGAGDAFAAGFIPTWIQKNDLQLAMNDGNAMAAKCVAIIGARPSVNPQ